MKKTHREDVRRTPPVKSAQIYLPRFGITDFSNGGEWKHFDDLKNDPISSHYLVMSEQRIYDNLKVQARELMFVGLEPDTPQATQAMEIFYRTFFINCQPQRTQRTQSKNQMRSWFRYRSAIHMCFQACDGFPL